MPAYISQTAHNVLSAVDMLVFLSKNISVTVLDYELICVQLFCILSLTMKH